MGKKVPFWQFFRKADRALFNLCMKFFKTLCQMQLSSPNYYGMWIKEILREKDKDLSRVGRNSDKK